jgi:hypothetical protein
MNEYIFAEFLFEDSAQLQGLDELYALGIDFIPTFTGTETMVGVDYNGESCFRVFGKLKSETATAIKLQNGFLATRMLISHISSEVKARYRN